MGRVGEKRPGEAGQAPHTKALVPQMGKGSCKKDKTWSLFRKRQLKTCNRPCPTWRSILSKLMSCLNNFERDRLLDHLKTAKTTASVQLLCVRVCTVTYREGPPELAVLQEGRLPLSKSVALLRVLYPREGPVDLHAAVQIRLQLLYQPLQEVQVPTCQSCTPETYLLQSQNFNQRKAFH